MKQARAKTVDDARERETWRPSGVRKATRAGAAFETIRMPSLEAIARRRLAWDVLIGCELERDDVFILALVDGKTSLETILDMTGFSPLRAATAVRRLLDMGILELDD